MSDDGQRDLYSIPLGENDFRDANTLMEFPWFDLNRRGSMKVKEFGAPGSPLHIRISPGARGMATEFDRDVLIYCISQLVREANEKARREQEAAGDQKPSKSSVKSKAQDGSSLPVKLTEDNTIQVRLKNGQLTMSVIAYDVLKASTKDTGKRAYEQLKDALFRLRSTTIETNIEVGGHRESRGFGWISDYNIVEAPDKNGHPRMQRVDITLSRWVLAAIASDRSVLSVNPLYFELESGLERRLYQLARKHCGRQPQFTISLGRLAEKVGTSRALNKFKHDLQKTIEQDNIPDYEFIIGGEEAAEAGTTIKRVRRGTLDRTKVLIRPRSAPHVGERVLRKVARQQELALA